MQMTMRPAYRLLDSLYLMSGVIADRMIGVGMMGLTSYSSGKYSVELIRHTPSNIFAIGVGLSLGWLSTVMAYRALQCVKDGYQPTMAVAKKAYNGGLQSREEAYKEFELLLMDRPKAKKNPELTAA